MTNQKYNYLDNFYLYNTINNFKTLLFLQNNFKKIKRQKLQLSSPAF